jgi:pentatricopeptide repeat domain-containing protein 1
MSGQAQEALRIYERMLAAGAQPTATTYTALISAYGKNGQLDKALQIFQVGAPPGWVWRPISGR